MLYALKTLGLAAGYIFLGLPHYAFGQSLSDLSMTTPELTSSVSYPTDTGLQIEVACTPAGSEEGYEVVVVLRDGLHVFDA